MNKTETAKYFGVSLTSIANWRRKGCPISKNGMMDPGAVQEWLIKRDWGQSGADRHLVRRFSRAGGEITRRLIWLNQQIKAANELPATDINGDSFGPEGTYKMAVYANLDALERILELPNRVMKRLPGEIRDPLTPLVLMCEEVVATLEERQSEEGESDAEPG